MPQPPLGHCQCSQGGNSCPILGALNRYVATFFSLRGPWKRRGRSILRLCSISRTGAPQRMGTPAQLLSIIPVMSKQTLRLQGNCWYVILCCPSLWTNPFTLNILPTFVCSFPNSFSSWFPAFTSLALNQLAFSKSRAHCRLSISWFPARPRLRACLPLTFLSSTNSFSAAVRLLISSSYLWECQCSVG